MANGPKPSGLIITLIAIYLAGIVGILVYIDLESTGGWPTTAWTVAALVGGLLLDA